MAPEQEAKLDAYFKKLDKFNDTVKDLIDAKNWQSSFLQSKLGYKPTPDSPDVDGEIQEYFQEEIDKINTTLHGADSVYGVATKVDIMWKGHFPIWATLSSGLTGIIVYFIVKMVGN